jgi:hypothetical protein
LAPNIKWDCGQTFSKAPNAQVLNASVGLTDQKNSPLYPNPANQTITINVSSFSHPKAVKLFDLSGKVLYDEKLGENQKNVQVNTSNFNNGYYLYQIIYEGGESSNKFLVQH